MKQVEYITETIWPDDRDQPWLTRLYWAELDGQLKCVGAEIRSARLPDRKTKRLPAEHSETLRAMATEEQESRGKLVRKMPREAGSVNWLRVDGDTLYDIPPSELTADRLKRFRFGQLVEEVKATHEDFNAIFAGVSEEAARLAEEWRRARERPGLKRSAGRPRLADDLPFLAIVRAAVREGEARGKKIETVRKRVAEAYPDNPDRHDAPTSTVQRWMSVARQPAKEAKR